MPEVRGQNYVSAITQKTTEANLMQLHRKIEHNEKMCRTQELGSYAQGEGHSQGSNCALNCVAP